MFEFVARLVWAALAVGWVFASRPSQLGVAIQAAAIYVAVAGFVRLLERRDLRTGPVSTAISLFDAVSVAGTLVLVGQTAQLGFLAALPLMVCVRNHGGAAPLLAPLAGACVLTPHNLLARQPVSPELLVQALACLALTYLAAPRPNVVAHTSPQESAESDPETHALQPAPVVNEDRDELRESYRRLREHTLEVESKSRKARWGIQLFDAVHHESGSPLSNLAHALHEISGAQGLTIYTTCQTHPSLVVQSAVGEVPAPMKVRRIPLNRDWSDASMRELAAKAHRENDTPAFADTLMVRKRAKVVGMVWFSAAQETELKAIRERLESVMDWVATLIDRNQSEVELRQKLSEANVLYAVSSTGQGSDTPRTLLARVINELATSLDTDHLSAQVLDGDEFLSVASHGQSLKLIDVMSFAKGQGVGGWLALDAPDLVIPDTQDDLRVPREAVLKRRIGAYCLLPIRVQGKIYGALCAGSQRAGGLGDRTTETLRWIAGELGKAIERLDGIQPATGGLVSPQELQSVLARSEGSLIVLDPLRKDEIREAFGAEVFAHTMRTLAQKVKALAPNGTFICRREEAVVIFMQDTPDTDARSWANEVVATVSMTRFEVPQKDQRVPLAVRAKVSAYQMPQTRLNTSDENTSSLEVPA